MRQASLSHRSDLTKNLVLTAVAAWAGLALSIAGAQTVVVQRQDVGDRYTLDGVVQATRQSTVAAQVAGRITQLAVKAGAHVRAGQLLVTLDDREATASVQNGRAQVVQADAMLRNAQAQYERTKALQQQGFLSKAALDSADAQYKSAAAAHEQALAGARQSALGQGYTRITAPFDGWVGNTFVDVGDMATPGKPIATIVAPQVLRAVVQVPLSLRGALKSARQIEIVSDDSTPGLRFTPTGRTELPVFDAATQTAEWRFDLPATAAAQWVVGQPVHLRFVGGVPPSPSAGRISLPQSAVVHRGELTAVYVVVGDAYVLRPVRIAAIAGGAAGSVDVVSGLQSGERVAIDPLRAAHSQ